MALSALLRMSEIAALADTKDCTIAFAAMGGAELLGAVKQRREQAQEPEP